MDKTWQRLSVHGNYLPFYTDRFLRIFPLFWVCLILTLPLWDGNVKHLLANFALYPLNLPLFYQGKIYISPTWSLACECLFYLIVPFLSVLSSKYIKGITLLSLLLFMYSPWSNSSAYWGYAGLPGILFTFGSGMLLSRKEIRMLRFLYICMIGLLFIFGMIKWQFPGLPFGISINVCLGFICCLPVIYWLSHFSPKNKVDQMIGMLAYPVFLIHGVCISYLSLFHIHHPLHTLLWSILIGCLLILFVDLPLNKVRFALRRRFASRSERKSPHPEVVLNGEITKKRFSD
jgi:peptidoglycan/LPS O-acetylase OafA/YrhL